MLVVLEGCDGSGKSTLAESLKEVLNAEIIHCSTTTPNTFFFFSQIIEAAVSKNIIADRFCYGQYIYQELEDRPMGDIERLYELENLMLKYNTKLVFVTAPDEEIQERLQNRGEHIINGLSVEAIQSRYKAMMKMSMLPWITWNTGGNRDV